MGNRFCRFGTQDSIGMGIELEKKFERLWMPAKFKMAVNGCPRNCAESGTKDFGVVGNDGGWDIFVGGNGGIKLRGADLLCKVKTDEELVAICGAYIQFYRETGKFGERTSEWVERMGLEAIREAVVENLESRQALNERVETALAQVEDPWMKVRNDRDLQRSLYGNMEYVEVGEFEQFPNRIGVRVQAGEEEIAVFRLTDGRIFALENRNPHRKGGIISEGLVSGEYLFDPLHDWKISLVTGKVQEPDSGQVKVYPVRVEAGKVSIELESK